jgi:hypothetical protein
VLHPLQVGGMDGEQCTLDGVEGDVEVLELSLPVFVGRRGATRRAWR